jgi:glutaredoxin 3
MPLIEMYCTSVCPYCRSAEMLLARKGVTRSEGRRTVPQIFIDGVHVGGFDDLSELNAEGKLDSMLGL